MSAASIVLACVVAAAPAPTSPAVAEVLADERALWEAWKAHDLARLEALTGEDYYSINEDGPAAAIGIADIRENFASWRLRDFRLGAMAARVIDPDTVVVVYNAHIYADDGHRDVSRGVAEASVWVRRGGRWRNVLLHEITREKPEHGLDD